MPLFGDIFRVVSKAYYGRPNKDLLSLNIEYEYDIIDYVSPLFRSTFTGPCLRSTHIL